MWTGFWGAGHEAFWEEQFAELVKFMKVHGHCMVPCERPEYKKLSTWVSTQRYRRKKRSKKKSLNKDQIKRLEKIGFIWDAKEVSWEEKFAELVEFQRTHGHCMVPYNFSGNPKLGKWVAKQRTKRRQGELSMSRIQRLKSIGFQWRDFRRSKENG